MATGRFAAVGAAVTFGLATAVIAAQAPAAQTPPPQNPPPASVDPSLAQGQGRQGAPIQMARAAIKGNNGMTGTATLYEIANSGNGHMVQVILSVQNAPPGMHGVHIHGVGRCEGDFKSAGGHFDPGPAGNPDPDENHPYHMGDLPNLNVNAQGTGQYNVYSTRMTMGGPTGLFDADGSAILIHQNLDANVTGPSGSGVAGGPAIACGVIER